MNKQTPEFIERIIDFNGEVVAIEAFTVDVSAAVDGMADNIYVLHTVNAQVIKASGGGVILRPADGIVKYVVNGFNKSNPAVHVCSIIGQQGGINLPINKVVGGSSSVEVIISLNGQSFLTANGTITLTFRKYTPFY